MKSEIFAIIKNTVSYKEVLSLINESYEGKLPIIAKINEEAFLEEDFPLEKYNDFEAVYNDNNTLEIGFTELNKTSFLIGDTTLWGDFLKKQEPRTEVKEMVAEMANILAKDSPEVIYFSENDQEVLDLFIKSVPFLEIKETLKNRLVDYSKIDEADKNSVILDNSL